MVIIFYIASILSLPLYAANQKELTLMRSAPSEKTAVTLGRNLMLIANVKVATFLNK